MNLLSLFVFVVYAAEYIISPLPDDGIVIAQHETKPSLSFGQLRTHATLDTDVLSIATETTPTPTLNPTPVLTPIPSPSPKEIRKTKKKHITIAVLGDSMIDTLGLDMPHLKTALQASYPATDFTLLNYGVGGTNISYGVERLTHEYTYLGRKIPSLVSQYPDLVIVESFGYNPFSYDTGALETHWLKLAEIIDVLKKSLPPAKVIIAATIAPNARTFGDNAPGLAFSINDKWQHVDTIKKYLESTTRFASSQHLPLADAYHPSLQEDGNGLQEYINPGDHIHPSDAGKAFFAEKILETMLSTHLLE